MDANARVVKTLPAGQQTLLKIMQGRGQRGGHRQRIGRVMLDDDDLLTLAQRAQFIQQQQAHRIGAGFGECRENHRREGKGGRYE